MPPTRKMNLVDLMILVAAMAVGLGLARMVLPEDDPHQVGRPGYHIVQYVHDLTIPCLAMLSIATVVLRLRGPRPGLREMFRRPGFVACVVAAFGTAFCVVMCLLAVQPEAPFRVGVLLLILSIWNLDTVGLTWFVMATTRRWQAEPSWIDRLGRAIGTLWIALPIGNLAGRAIL